MSNVRIRLAAAVLAIGAAVVPPPATAAPAAAPAPARHASHPGVHEVVLADGYRLLTHGGEPRTPEWMDPPVADHGGRGWPHDERQPVCGSAHYQHFLYTRPGGSVLGLFEQAKPVIQTAARQMNAVLNAAARASGGVSADFLVKCDEKGDVAVDAFPTVGVDFDSVVLAARLAGFDDPDVDYTIFVQAPFVFCGQGNFHTDDTPGEDNPNNAGGDYAVVWDGCWLGRTPMHENGHNQGAVQDGAPHSTGAGHCNDQSDVMCYSDLGPTDRGDFVACADRIHYDCGDDSYFDAAPEPGEWLSEHWNIGDRGNRFIVFGRDASG